MITKKIIFFLFFITVFSCAATVPEDDSETIKLPYMYSDESVNWEMITDLSDEFNSDDIDSDKWNTHYPYWKGRPPSWFMDENVTVADGILQIQMKTKEDTNGEMDSNIDYSCGILRSKTTFLYGYAEIRSRAMPSAGSSSFWLNNATENWWTEIDIYEIGGNAENHEYSIHTNIHEFYTPDTPKDQYTPFDDQSKSHFDQHVTETTSWRPDSGFHIYGVEWNETNIIWYVDGKEIRRFKHDGRFSQEFYVNIDSEVMEGWWGLPEDKDLPSSYLVDYVRIWQIVD